MFYFLHFYKLINKLRKYFFHLGKWNFKVIGYFGHITEFLALVKVLLTYIWRWFAKCSSSSLYSARGDRGLKKITKIFSNKCPFIFSIRPNWRKEVFFERDRQEWCNKRLPQTSLSFYEIKTFLLLWNLNNTTPSFSSF